VSPIWHSYIEFANAILLVTCVLSRSPCSPIVSNNDMEMIGVWNGLILNFMVCGSKMMMF
jgi:hypothetical protein